MLQIICWFSIAVPNAVSDFWMCALSAFSSQVNDFEVAFPDT